MDAPGMTLNYPLANAAFMVLVAIAFTKIGVCIYRGKNLKRVA